VKATPHCRNLIHVCREGREGDAKPDTTAQGGQHKLPIATRGCQLRFQAGVFAWEILGRVWMQTTLTCFNILWRFMGYLITSDHQLYRVLIFETPFGLLIRYITIPITRNYNYSQLFITLCHIYTAYNHTRLWLQSLITLLHWLTSQLSITHFTSSHFETLAEILLREFTS
jgi:hypothetical protein